MMAPLAALNCFSAIAATRTASYSRVTIDDRVGDVRLARPMISATPALIPSSLASFAALLHDEISSALLQRFRTVALDARHRTVRRLMGLSATDFVSPALDDRSVRRPRTQRPRRLGKVVAVRD